MNPDKDPADKKVKEEHGTMDPVKKQESPPKAV